MNKQVSPDRINDPRAREMRAVQLPDGHPPVKAGRIGVLLVNLGTPDATDYWSMRRYLKEFLSDRRVIETPRWLWWPILNLIILTTRPSKKGKDYDSIWNREKDEGPLKTITRAQADALRDSLTALDNRIVVDWAMRYGNPSIPSRLDALQKEGCERILVIPLYPQYSAATSATVCDKVFDALKGMRWQPALRVAPPYHDDPAYIDAVADTMQADLDRLDFEPDVILASFHGVPQEYLDKGDPYHCHCMKTWRLLRERLGMDKEKFRMSFQSRFGTAEWLKPYTDETVKGLAESGVKKLAIVAPGFSADCLETLEELDVENREIFEEHGGEKFAYLPALNESEAGMRVIRAIAMRELQGWI
jgi:ferrochelatase